MFGEALFAAVHWRTTPCTPTVLPRATQGLFRSETNQFFKRELYQRV